MMGAVGELLRTTATSGHDDFLEQMWIYGRLKSRTRGQPSRERGALKSVKQLRRPRKDILSRCFKANRWVQTHNRFLQIVTA
jgi:hypothetical protein